MEEATGAPSSFAALSPRRLRASSRDGGGVMNRPPSPLTMLLSRHTRRRHFVALLGAAALPLPVRAQPEMVVAGFLSARSPDEAEAHTAAFLRALTEAGYVPGRNLAVEYRWAEGHYDRLPTLATDLAKKKVALIAAVGGINSALAAKAATSTTPIIFIIGDDPVSLGLVESMNRPGTNATGVSLITVALSGKRLELICALSF